MFSRWKISLSTSIELDFLNADYKCVSVNSKRKNIDGFLNATGGPCILENWYCYQSRGQTLKGFGNSSIVF